MFKDRIHAGQMLAEKLAAVKTDHLRLLAVPRGGVVVAAPIALKLQCSLGVLVTRKIGHPLNSEVAFGAVMPDGSAVWDQAVAAKFSIDQARMNELILAEYTEIKRRLRVYTGDDRPPSVTGRSVIIVDDGIATGYTIHAAVQWLKTLEPAKIIIAVPVASPDVIEWLTAQADAVICLLQPADFAAVGMYYEDFSQTTDAEVLDILQR
jgi:putative phosphoribosyl transferase